MVPHSSSARGLLLAFLLAALLLAPRPAYGATAGAPQPGVAYACAAETSGGDDRT